MQYTLDSENLKSADTLQVAIASTATFLSSEENAKGIYTKIPTSRYMEASVSSTNATTNYGTNSQYIVGVDSTMGVCRSYISFDISDLGIAYDKILSANYSVARRNITTGPLQIEAYMVTGPWTETGITWNNKPNYINEKIITVNAYWDDGRTYHDFYITQAIMAWRQGMPNYGIMLKTRIEDGVGYVKFAGHESSVYLPRLSVTYTTDETSMSNIGVKDEEVYYIKNKNSGLYLTAAGTTAGSNVTQTSWTGNAAQKWKVQKQTSGYYKLIPQNAASLVLDTAGGNNADGAEIQLYSSNTGLGQQFKFIRNWDGSYRIVTRLSSDARGLKAENSNEVDGGNVHHWTYTTNWIKSDDWTLEAVTKGDAEVFTFTDTDADEYDLDTFQYSGGMVAPLNAMGYEVYSQVDFDHKKAYEFISTDSIFVFSGHGSESAIWFKTGAITAVDDSDTEYAVIGQKPHNDFCGLKLAVFASCSTGQDFPAEEGNGGNMVGEVYRKGVHFVIAHTDITSTPCGDIWVQQFLAACGNGKTIYEAMIQADNYLYENYSWDAIYGNANQRHVLGDNSLRIDR